MNAARVQIDRTILTLKELSVDERKFIHEEFLSYRATTDMVFGFLTLKELLRKSIKSLEVQREDGSWLHVEFRTLPNESINGFLMALFDDQPMYADKLAQVCHQLMFGFPKEFYDLEGKQIEGVEVLSSPFAYIY